MLWTATGCVHAFTNISNAPVRWLETQGEQPHYPFPDVRGGWLLGLPALHSRRAPGNTCLAALRGTHPGTLMKSEMPARVAAALKRLVCPTIQSVMRR